LADQRMRELRFNQFSTATLTWGESMAKNFAVEVCVRKCLGQERKMKFISFIDLACLLSI
jgi:hypothetical protein